MAMMLLYIGLVAGAFICTMVRPAVAVGALICTSVLEQWAQANMSYFVEHYTTTNILTASTVAVGLLVRFATRRGALLTFPKVALPIAMLFAYSLLSLLWSIYPSASIAIWRGFGVYVLVYVFMASMLVTGLDDVRDALLSIGVFGAILLALVLATVEYQGRSIQFAGEVMDTTFGSAKRQTGTPLHVASLAAYVGLIFLLSNFRGAARWLNMLRWVIVVVAAAAIIKSASRGQFVAFLLSALVFLPLSRRMTNVRGFVIAAVSSLVFLAALYFTFVFVAESSRWEWEYWARDVQEGRIERVVAVLGYWIRSSPIYHVFGLGAAASFSPDVHGFFPEMVYAEVLAEYGFIGFGLLASVVVLTMRLMARGWRSSIDTLDRRGLVAVLGALCLFEFIVMMKQGTLMWNYTAFLFPIVLGKTVSAIEQERALFGNRN